VLEAGFEYNLSDLQAAIGVEQLKKIERLRSRRRELAERYRRAFAGMPEVECPPEAVEQGGTRGTCIFCGCGRSGSRLGGMRF
jgi:dTDP-4-amino-4,6-dideoxygalactose transaminase